MIVIVDYGVGNLRSVSNMFRRAGAAATISGDEAEITAADKLLLPGVGRFDHAMRMLRAAGLEQALSRYATELRRPVLGICLGAQILGKGSEEGQEPGLGWIDMECRRLPESGGFRVPHMGWNQVTPRRECPLLADATHDTRFYFAHSYYMDCANEADIAATTSHGIEFTSVIQSRNLFGAQFHPEKSLGHGLRLLRAFAAL